MLPTGKFSFQEGDVAYFFQENNTIELPALLLSGFELGYAITVHKSQGSEFNRVALVVSQGAQVFG